MLVIIRAYVGRGLAGMQLPVNVATVFWLYGIVLENPGAPMSRWYIAFGLKLIYV